MPGSKPDNHNLSSTEQDQPLRPASIDRKNLSNGVRPEDTANSGGLGDSNPTYENWPVSGSGTTTVNKLTHKPLLPPPPVAQRHKISASPEDSIAYGHQTDSFIVPNLHQSQFIPGPVGAGKVVSPAHAVHKPILPPDKPTVGKTLSTDTSTSEESISHQIDFPAAASSPVRKSIESSTEDTKSTATGSSTYSPRMHTKLAKMTKIPATKEQSSSAMERKPGPSRSFSQRTTSPYHHQSSTKTLPPKQQSTQENESGAELLRKLKERRQKLERQLSSGDIVQSNDNRDSSSSTGEGVLRWTGNKEMESTNLSNFGIVEEGGTFVV